MPRKKEQTEASSFAMYPLADELAMAVWNRLAHQPQFEHLQPKDYPELLDVIWRLLKLYRARR